MTVTGGGTNGGGRGTDGARRNVAVFLMAGFLVILSAITIGNAESTISELAAAGIHERPAHVWTWEVTSVVAWLTVTPLMWWSVAQARSHRPGWHIVGMAWIAGLLLASAWHIGLMIVLRHGVYAMLGERYHFEGKLASPYLYEFRKDIATYLQLTGAATLAQWLLARAGTPVETAPLAASRPGALTVTDGTTRHLLPLEVIEHVVAAGNYVEVSAEGRTLLHRATLTHVENELGVAFVRIHRSRIVNRAAIRRIDTDRSGDFSVYLANGSVLGGSRRYRNQL